MPPSADESLLELFARVRFVAFDFDGVFTDNAVYTFEDQREAVRCWRGDGLGLRKLRQLGIGTSIISMETNPVVTARGRKLGIRVLQGIEEKRQVLEGLLDEYRLSLADCAYVGNDINDIPCLECVALPIVVHDSHPDVLAYGRYRTRTCGGQGAVREICDLIASVHGDHDLEQQRITEERRINGGR